MGASKPCTRPQLPSIDVRKIAEHIGIRVDQAGEVAVLAIRGYYRDSMGARGKNDRGIYDDAAWIILHDRCVPFNFNTDPTGYAEGRATLMDRISLVIPGKHHIASPPPKGRPGFRQFGRVHVQRDDRKGLDVGDFGINIHDGGEGNTSSEGCLTVPKSQWKEFLDTICAALKVTPEQMMKQPAGIPGKQFARGLITREEAEQILGREL